MAHKSLDWQLHASETQLEQRRSMSDQLDRPREVDHFAYFRKRANAEEVATQLRTDGYTVELSRKGFTTSLAAHKDSPVDSATVTAFVTKMFDLVESNGGEYDGWGGSVVTG
jgi:hypothetical protein